MDRTTTSSCSYMDLPHHPFARMDPTCMDPIRRRRARRIRSEGSAPRCAGSAQASVSGCPESRLLHRARPAERAGSDGVRPHLLRVPLHAISEHLLHADHRARRMVPERGAALGAVLKSGLALASPMVPRHVWQHWRDRVWGCSAQQHVVGLGRKGRGRVGHCQPEDGASTARRCASAPADPLGCVLVCWTGCGAC